MPTKGRGVKDRGGYTRLELHTRTTRIKVAGLMKHHVVLITVGAVRTFGGS